MVVQSSKLSCPLTAFALVRAVNFEVVEHMLEALVVKICKVSSATCRTRFVLTFDSVQAVLAEAVATAGGLVGFS